MLVVMVGLPGSGKSTEVAKYMKGENTVVLSSDVFREVLCGDVNDQKHNAFVFETLYKAMEIALKENKDVIFDATNLTVKSRSKALALAKKYGSRTIAYVMDTPFADCLTRNANRSRSVPEDVIYSMRDRYVTPTIEEGFDNVII